ncbi:MAG: hypothetical protein ABSF10_20430 [Verrucomicrobiota bacterium]|jgi:hypothetical protein
MTFNELINEAMAAASQGRLAPKSDEELNALLSACRQYCASNPHGHTFDPTMIALRDEIARRANERDQAEARNQHEAVMGQGKDHHKETMGEMGKLKTSVDGLKTSVDQLARTRRIEWWILAAGWIAAVAGVAAVLLEFFLKHSP